MADQSKIEWTDATWNPIRGCSRVSEGCRNCYAERVAARFSGPGQAYEGLAKMTASGPRWTGELRVIEDHLEDPRRWKRPRRIFVNSMSDLFHENISDATLTLLFAVMLDAKQHTYQILTKRPERMAVLLSRWASLDGHPLPNHIWLGVSVEDQSTADARISWLLKTPATVRWVSYEPALGPVDFAPWLTGPGECIYPTPGNPTRGIDWIVVGGESGPGARPFDIQWARDVIAMADVPCFVKQLGARPVDGLRMSLDHDRLPLKLKDKKGGDPSEWAEDLRVREYPKVP